MYAVQGQVIVDDDVDAISMNSVLSFFLPSDLFSLHQFTLQINPKRLGALYVVDKLNLS